MDDPKDFLKNNDLEGALASIQDTIRKDPSEAKHRIFLFQLLSVLGDWKRAIAQLKLSAELDPLALMMAQTYREGIICEIYREKVFLGEKTPLFFGKPEEWTALIFEALKALSAGNYSEAEKLRNSAFDMAPSISGELNGEPFEWIADADMRLGPILEAIVDGKYYWMPFNVIKSLTVEEPVDLRDSVWMPAGIKLLNGGDIVALIPTRYAGTLSTNENKLKLSRETNWEDIGNGTYIGTGQRIFATDTGDVSLMDLRTLNMHSSSSESNKNDG